MEVFYIFLRSMVNCMTSNPSSRVSLVSCRNAFTMVRILYSSVFSVMSKLQNAASDMLNFHAFARLQILTCMELLC